MEAKVDRQFTTADAWAKLKTIGGCAKFII